MNLSQHKKEHIVLGVDKEIEDLRRLINSKVNEWGGSRTPVSGGGGASLAIGSTVTSGTEGSVLFIGASGALAQDNANFFWDDTNNRLGIGTTSPNAKLEVSGGDIYCFASGLNPRFLFGDSSGSTDYGGLRWDSTTNSIQLGTDAGGYTIVLPPNGNMGVGTAVGTANAKLHVLGAASGKTAIFQANATTPGSQLEFQDSGGTVQSSFGSNGHLGLGTTASTTNGMRLVFGGGTAGFIYSDNSELDYGMTVGSTSSAVMQLGADSGFTGALQLFPALNTSTGYRAVINQRAADVKALTIRMAATPTANALTIENSSLTGLSAITGTGNIGVGTVSPAFALSSLGVHIKGVNPVLRLESTSSGGQAWELLSTISPVSLFLWDVTAGSYTMQWDSAGNVGIGNGAGTTGARLEVQGKASAKTLILRASATTPGNAAEVQNSSGTAYLTVGPPTLSGSSTTSNWLNLTATMPSTMTNTTYGVLFAVTGAGSSNQLNQAFRINYSAGYTGANISTAASFVNLNAGTGNNFNSFNAGAGITSNQGINGYSGATTTGMNIGGQYIAENGDVSIGSVHVATTAKNSGTNIGVLGVALNTGTSPIQIGGYFGLHSAAPTFSSAALMADNGSTTSNIFVARDNGTAVFTIADGGAVTFTGEISGFKASFNNQTGTTYTLADSDNGKVVTLSNASGITVTVPNSLATGFNCRLIQLGAGQVTVAAGASATMHNRSSHTKIAGQYGEASIIVTSNAGSAAVFNFAGDTAA